MLLQQPVHLQWAGSWWTALTLRVQSTQPWSTYELYIYINTFIYGFSIRDRNYGLGYVFRIWVLGPLGLQEALLGTEVTEARHRSKCGVLVTGT